MAKGEVLVVARSGGAEPGRKRYIEEDIGDDRVLVY